MKSLIFFVIISVYFTLTNSLECYVCSQQDKNHEKCLNTIKICEQGEDACLTEVKWGTMPYWQQGAEKQYYVSKKCATKQICEQTRARWMPFCTYIWYEDWKCTHCCSGDRCNYYAILGASSVKTSFTILATCFTVAFLFQRFFY